MSLDAVAAGLSTTTPSQWLQAQAWAVPAIQTVHILAIAVVMSSILMTDLRLVGLLGRSEGLATVAKRYLTWLWGALAVLLLSGALLVLAEPERALTNRVFQLKMVLLLIAVLVTSTIHLGARKSPGRQPARRVAVGLALGSLSLWVAIVFAGRWIAYAVE